MSSLRQVAWATMLITCALLDQSRRCHSFVTTNSRNRCTLCRESSESDNSRHSTGKPLNQDRQEVAQRVQTKNNNLLSRREALLSAALATAFIPLAAQAISDEKSKSLEDIAFGHGQWTKTSEKPSAAVQIIVPASFATYAARFLIQYDEGVSSWWADRNRYYSLLTDEQRYIKLGNDVGCLAASVQSALGEFVSQFSTSTQGYSEVSRLLLDKYGGMHADAKRHIGILCAILPPDQQPIDILNQLSSGRPASSSSSSISKNRMPNPAPRILTDDLSSLLPQEYHCAPVKGTLAFTITPAINLFEVGVDEEFGQTAIATAFGPLSSAPLTRGKPDYTLDTYAIFGISGATGCVLTHSLVIPLDVIKTKTQTDPDEYNNFMETASRILEEDGVQGFLTGVQATVAGYLWYGLSVYPSYTFFKRFMTLSLLPPEIALVHVNDIALLAGALAAVIASLGLTPLEAARIRAVADPVQYKPLGLFGTLGVIATEDAQLGWKAAYAGLPSLMTRQVIFGSIKFLAFERACEAIFSVWPFLRDETWTLLAVSLVAGGFSGCLSSVVSHPADAVLTYVAQNGSDNSGSISKGGGGGSLGVVEGCRLMVQEEGISSLYRGLGSRCVWAGCIIAGQFLLYDIFRSYFGVSVQDLSQVFQVVIP
jgi:solute carrier family 25 phosphate transporter 3